MRLHRAAAARTAVADRVEAVEHGVFEERVVYVPSGVLCLQDRLRLGRRDPPGAAGVVLDDEPGEGLAYDEADIQRPARVPPGGAARTLESDDVIRIAEDDGSSARVGDHLLEVPHPDLLTDGYQPSSRFEWHHLPVVSVGGGAIVALGGAPARQAAPQPGKEPSGRASQCSPVPMLM